MRARVKSTRSWNNLARHPKNVWGRCLDGASRHCRVSARVSCRNRDWDGHRRSACEVHIHRVLCTYVQIFRKPIFRSTLSSAALEALLTRASTASSIKRSPQKGHMIHLGIPCSRVSLRETLLYSPKLGFLMELKRSGDNIVL